MLPSDIQNAIQFGLDSVLSSRNNEMSIEIEAERPWKVLGLPIPCSFRTSSATLNATAWNRSRLRMFLD